MSLKKYALAALLCVPYLFAFAIELPAPQSTPVAPAKQEIQMQPARAVAGKPQIGAGQNASAPGSKAIRKKDLSFEGRGVEALIGKDYDSLSQTGTVEQANREKLYKTRLFMNESENLLQELEYSR